MRISDYLFKHLSTLAKTSPLNVPMGTKLPFITYEISGRDETKTSSGGYIENFVTVTAFEGEYDKAELLGEKIKSTLECVEDENIIGTTFTSRSNEYTGEPVDTYSTIIEITIFERF